MKRISLVGLAALSLASCVSTQVMPLAPNVVRINTKASGLLYQGRAVPETMTAAAKETLARGYTHFRFSDANAGQGSEVIGTSSWGSANANATGNAANFNAFGGTTVERTNTEGAAVTVTMFRADEPSAKDAFDAQQVLAQYQPRQ